MERLLALKSLAPVAVLIMAVLGCIYKGIATVTEAAALGVLVTVFCLGQSYVELGNLAGMFIGCSQNDEHDNSDRDGCLIFVTCNGNFRYSP